MKTRLLRPVGTARALVLAWLLSCGAGAVGAQGSDQQDFEDARSRWEDARKDWVETRQPTRAVAALLQQQAATAGNKQRPNVCTLAQRQSEDLPPLSCCDSQMLGELWALRDQGYQLVQNAIGRLDNPARVKGALAAHFRLTPENRAEIAAVKAQYNRMLTAMKAADVQLLCRDLGDPGFCNGRKGAADNCSSTTPRHLLACGYVVFWQSAGSAPVFPPSTLKTLIHEYAHIGCPAGSGAIMPESVDSGPERGHKEFYEDKPDYPGPNPTKNADSYASFALAVRL